VPAPLVIAHGLVGRADLPIPAAWFGAAAAAVLVISFAALAAGWSEPRLQTPRERPLFRLPFVVEVVLGMVGVAGFAAVVWSGLAGTGVPSDNLAPEVVYVLFWVGIPFATLVFGDVFRLLSPWRAIGRAAGTLVRRVGGPELTEPLPYPERLGRWPAALGLALFAAAELCWGKGSDPQVVAVLALVYLIVQFVGMGLYGVEAWTRNGDAFGVYFGMFARLAPIGRRADGRLVLRPPLSAAPALDVPPGTVGLLLVGIGSTTFDGAKEGPLFNAVAPWLQDLFHSLGLSKGSALELAFVVGLVAAIAFVAAIYHGGTAGMRVPGATRAFAHTLIPIAAAYLVAHYFSLLAYQGQSAIALVSDPLGDGSDLFGTADRRIDYSVISSTGIWYVQVGALVIGHVAALVLAHDRALALTGSARAAIRSQVAMLAVMVAFTCLGLWQLSVANR
jgi:hypothetical protein